MSEWRLVKLAELAASAAGAIAIGPFGSALKASEYAAAGVPVVRGQNLNRGRYIDDTDLVYVPEEIAHRLQRSMVKPGDLVFPHRGAIGSVGLVRGREYLLSSSMMKFSGDLSKVDPRYLTYYFLGPGRRELMIRASTVGTPGIAQPLSSLRDIDVRLPSLQQQRAIAEVLGALDDKIEANRKLATTADDLSRLKFKAMQTVSGSGLVPLSDTARFVNGRAFTKDATGTGRVVIRIAELNSGLSGSTVRNDIDVHEDHLARPGDLLFAWSGSLTLARWFRGEAIVNQHIFKVIPGDGYPLWLVRQLVGDKLREFQAIAADKATTMGHIQRRHLDEPVLIPPAPAIDAADEAMGALWRRALLAEMQSERLIVLRDALLPKLMSGQLRVREAELLVANAV